MVSQALVQEKLNYGNGKAATVLGADCTWYRPNGVDDPLAAVNELGTIPAYFRPPSGPFTTPIMVGKPEFLGTFDATDVQPFDYLTEPVMGTFFVAAIDPLSNALCIRCNRTLTFSRPGATAPGPNYYGGDVTASETPLMANWPASVLIKSRGSQGETKLPGDVKLPPYEVLMPAPAGIDLVMGDMIRDDEGSLYSVSSAELSAHGWRLLAILATP